MIKWGRRVWKTPRGRGRAARSRKSSRKMKI